jgi:hypothetical protein
MPRASEVMLATGDEGPLLSDALIRTSCPTCGMEQPLDEATLDETNPLETIYLCQNECGPVLLIVPAIGLTEDGKMRGMRYGDWLVRNPCVLYLYPVGFTERFEIPATPDYLD